MSRIFIAIPVYNRLRIAEECIPTVISGTDQDRDTVMLFNDGSTEFNGAALLRGFPNDLVVQTVGSIGIERQRRRHFLHFAERMDRMDWTHLYLTDADALHDPNWRTELLRIQQAHGNAPVCGYNTEAHARLPGNTIDHALGGEVIWRRVAPGISYLLTREHVDVVVKALPHLPEHWHWDWTVPSLLGHRMAITRTSYVDHIGLGGRHHPEGAGLDGGDRALNPTPWLVKKRAEVVAKLEVK